MPTPRAPAAHIVFNTLGQQYRQTTPFTFLGSAVTKTQNMSAEIYWRIRARWISFRRYKGEIYDRPKASLLQLKVIRGGSRGSPVWMRDVNPSCRPTRTSSVLHITGCCFTSSAGASRRTTAPSPSSTPSNELDVRVTKQPCEREVFGGGGAALPGRPQVIQENHSRRVGEHRSTWAEGK